MQNLGGIGVALISKLTLEAGSVNGIGRLAPVSSVLQDTPHAKTEMAPRRKKLPIANKRRMYSTRLHPKVIDALNALKSKRGEPASRIIENLIIKEVNRLGL